MSAYTVESDDPEYPDRIVLRRAIGGLYWHDDEVLVVLTKHDAWLVASMLADEVQVADARKPSA